MRNFIVAAAALLFVATGCTHEPFKVIAGKGGNAIVTVYPQHHGQTSALENMIVYVKYNTKDAPANGSYDDSAVCTYLNALPSCAFASLKNGDYYFFTKGYDNQVEANVKGGFPYTITTQQSQSILLPVGEESGF